MADPQTRAIVVPAEGLEEAEVFSVLGLTSLLVYPLLGDELLAPRDYRYPSRPSFSTNYYTPSGVRALVLHFGLPIEVRSPGEPTKTPPPEFWWQKDNA